MTKEMFFHWHYFQEKLSYEPRGIFYLDAPSASVCLLIQLERHATEEGGVTSSVYSRKEPVYPKKSLNFRFLLVALNLFHNELKFDICVDYQSATFLVCLFLVSSLSFKWKMSIFCHFFLFSILVLLTSWEINAMSVFNKLLNFVNLC